MISHTYLTNEYDLIIGFPYREISMIKKVMPRTGAWRFATRSKEAMQGYRSWLHQRGRCYTKTNAKYQYYGARGIEVEYSSVEFVKWWVKQLKTSFWKSPTVGRIDHAKNYSFDNIKMEERSDNSKERMARIGRKGMHPPTRAIILIDMKTGSVLNEYVSLSEAQKHTGISVGNIYSICRGLRKGTRKGITFRYKEVSHQQ